MPRLRKIKDARESIELTLQARLLELDGAATWEARDIVINNNSLRCMLSSCFLCTRVEQNSLSCLACPFLTVFSHHCPNEYGYMHVEPEMAVSVALQLQYYYDKKFPERKKNGRHKRPNKS